MQWQIENELKDNQWYTKYHTENYIKTGGELRCPGKISSSCSTSTRCGSRISS